MDRLDQRNSSSRGDTPEYIDAALLVEEHIVDTDDEVMNSMSPQTLLETPADDTDDSVQFTFRSTDGITYGLLKLEGDDERSTVVQTNVVPQMVNSNRQIYVVSNTPVVRRSTQSTSNRTLLPRPGPSAGQTLLPVQSVSKTKRDDRRRETHKEVEQRRRAKINSWISRLAKLLPEDFSAETQRNGHFEGQSKGGILARACEYIADLTDSVSDYDHLKMENKRLEEALEANRKKVSVLWEQNMEMREILRENDIEFKIKPALPS